MRRPRGAAAGNKKRPACQQAFFYVPLALGNRTYGAAASASAAVYTDVRVDLVLGITLRDRAYRALGLAGTAADASGANYMCHE